MGKSQERLFISVVVPLYLKPTQYLIQTMTPTYDLIILGSGPAGFSSAMQASKFDKKALVIEANPDYLGGTWINTGTVPSKALREAAHNIYKYTNQFGGFEKKKPYERFTMKDLLHFKNLVLNQENQEVRKNLIKNEVEIVNGIGQIIDANTVEVFTHEGEKKIYTAKFILVSTGSTPLPPKKFEIDHYRVLDAHSLLKLDHIPRRLVVVGVGVNAIEYASMFAAMGSKVTILNENDAILPFLDEEIKNSFFSCLDAQGIVIQNNVDMRGVRSNPIRNCTEVRFEKEDGETHVIETEHVLYFGGRQPNSDNIGLENVGVQRDAEGYIKTNTYFQTSIDNIYAAGDIVGFPRLASVSFTQGRLATCHMFDIPSLNVPAEIPFGIYAIPEISSIGLTEEEATRQGLNYAVGRSLFKNLTRAAIGNAPEGMLKIIFDKDSYKLLGVHILGEQACELIHIGQAIISFDGDVRYFINHVFNYPTFAEAYRQAAFNGINRVLKAGVKYKKGIQEEDDKTAH